MPQGKRTRDRHLAKLAERRRLERRRRQRRKAITIGVALAVAAAGLSLLGVAFLGGKSKPTAAPTPTATPAPTPTAQGSPGSNCGYTAKQEATGSKGTIAPPTFTIDVKKSYTATVETSMGTFDIQLVPQAAPCTVNSFVYLAKQHFFDGLTFHRVVKDFVIQGGDPAGNGSGGPGYSFNDELANSLTYHVGSVAMANSGPNTNGSQWFVVTGSQGTSLPKQYTIFGQISSGLPVVLKIGQVPTKGGSGADAGTPVTPVTIVKVTVKVS